MYSYDRRLASSRKRIVDLIVQQVLRERETKPLMEAWISDAIEDWQEDTEDEPPGDSMTEYNRWLEQEIGVLLDKNDIEKSLQTAYVDLYRKLVRGTSQASALEVFDYPDIIPDARVPKEVAVAIGEAMAKRDAVDAIALKELAQERYGH